MRGCPRLSTAGWLLSPGKQEGLTGAAIGCWQRLSGEAAQAPGLVPRVVCAQCYSQKPKSKTLRTV